jgi:hypothetical protein
MRACLLRLHREERAQVSFLAVAAALVFVGLLAMVINTNDLVRERVRMQEVADVSALSAATWHARGMNMVSMINVLNSKLLSMTVLVNSLNKTLPIVEQIAIAQISAFTACSAVPVVGAFCAVMVGVVQAQRAIVSVMKTVIKSVAKFTACKQLVWTAMSSLQSAAEGVRMSFANIGTASSLEIATANGASLGVALNGGLLSGAAGLTLPVSTDNRTQSDFCTAMKDGGPGYVMEGYDNNQGPVRLGKKIWDLVFIPFVNLLPHPIFYGFYTFYMNQIGCTPDPNSQDNAVETNFDLLSECRKYNVQATWQNYEARTGWVSNGGWDKDDFVDWKPKFHNSSGDSGVDTDDYDDLGDYGIADPLAPGPSLPFSHGAGYNALEDEWLREDDTEVPCAASVPSSGYPTVSNNILDAAGCALFGSCTSLPQHPDYSRYRGQPRQREDAGNERKGVFFLSLAREDQAFDDGSGGSVTRYRYTIDVWTLVSAGSKELEGDELDEYVQDQSGQSTKPTEADKQAAKSCKNWVQPLLLDPGSDDRMRYIAMVYSELGTDGHPLPFWSNFFTSPPDRIYAYAQSQVYNKLSEDMFTQDWRARLEQTSLLESALGAGSGFELGGSGAGGISGAIIEPINNH